MCPKLSGPRCSHSELKHPDPPLLSPHRVWGQAGNGETHPDRGGVRSRCRGGALASQPERRFPALLWSDSRGGPLAIVGSTLLQPVRPASGQKGCSAPPIITGSPPQPHQIPMRSETTMTKPVATCAMGWPQWRQPLVPTPPHPRASGYPYANERVEHGLGGAASRARAWAAASGRTSCRAGLWGTNRG